MVALAEESCVSASAHPLLSPRSGREAAISKWWLDYEFCPDGGGGFRR